MMTECLTHDFYDPLPCPHCAEVDALRAELAALTRKLAEREAEIATIKGQLEYERNNDIYQDDRSDA